MEKKNVPAWQFICAIMDRLDDETEYLNNMELGKNKIYQTAFDFIDFITHGAVLIDCIKKLKEIYNVGNNELQSKIFRAISELPDGSDYQYFEYLRSICSVHPIETSRHPEYHGKGIIECCPYVVWIKNNSENELRARVYSSTNEDFIKEINISVNEVFEYIKAKYDYIRIITKKIKEYQDGIIKDWINKVIPAKEEFLNYGEYLESLKNEDDKRCGFYKNDLEHVQKIMNFKLEDVQNMQLFKLYKNAIKYAVQLLHKQLQKMFVNGYKEDENYYEHDFICKLFSLDGVSFNNCSYSNEKMLPFCYPELGDTYWAKKQFEKMKPNIERYLHVDGNENDFEKYLLWEMACYFNSLENQGPINAIIPNSEEYRIKLLSEDEHEAIKKNYRRNIENSYSAEGKNNNIIIINDISD